MGQDNSTPATIIPPYTQHRNAHVTDTIATVQAYQPQTIGVSQYNAPVVAQPIVAASTTPIDIAPVVPASHPPEEQRSLYVISLEGGKYYVGITNNLQQRITQHKEGCGCVWTKKHVFDRLVSSEPLQHSLDEDTKVEKLMMQHGIDNVRGGSYSNIVLTNEQTDALTRKISHANNHCLKCDKPGHYAKDCNTKKLVVECSRCGRNSHTKEKCYATTLHLSGIPVKDLNFCGLCGRDNHSNGNYFAELFKCSHDSNRYGKKVRCGNFCERCGRIGHTIVECFANTKYDKRPM